MTNPLQEVDARGLSCPEPLWLTKSALDGMTAGMLVVLVDDPTALANVTRLAEQQGCTVETNEDGDDYHVCITKA